MIEYGPIGRQKVDLNEREVEENYLNLWTYLRRRYPEADIESMNFFELVHFKQNQEGPHNLRLNDCEIASVRRR